MAETLTELVARIKVDATNLQKGLASAEKDVKGLGKDIDKETRSIKQRFLEIGKTATIMGATITAAMGLAIRSFIKTGSELNDLSLKTGVSIKALAGLKYAAEQNGASLGTVEMAIRRTAAAMQDAKDGLVETKRAFDRMGVSLAELEGLKPEDQFMKIASAIAEIPDPMTRAATAQDLFGRSGMDMLPMLSQGAEGLRKMMEEGVKHSRWSEAAASLADSLGDSFDTLKTAMAGIFNIIGVSLAPALKGLADSLTKIIGSVADWIQAHPSLVKAIGTATLAMGLFATGVGLASLAVKYLGTTTNLYFGGILLIIGAVVAGIVLLIDWFDRSGAATRRLAAENKIALEKQQADNKALFNQKRAAVEEIYGKSIQAIREEYGITKEVAKSKMDLAREVRDNAIRNIELESDKATDAHRTRLAEIEDEYRAGLDKISQGYQAQIDAIDAQTDTEDKARRLAELKERVSLATTTKDAQDAQRDLDRYLLLEQREAAKAALRLKIDEVRASANIESATQDASIIHLRNIRNKEIEINNESLRVTLENNNKALVAEQAGFVIKIDLLEKEQNEKIKVEEEKLASALHSISREETALRNSYVTRLKETTDWVRAMNSEYAKMGIAPSTPAGTTGVAPTFLNPNYTQTAYEADLALLRRNLTEDQKQILGLQHGGIVTQPTLAMVGESGTEAIIPLNETGGMGGITINFTQPVFFDREDTMNRFVDMIRKGIQRQDRIRFGGAYSA